MDKPSPSSPWGTILKALRPVRRGGRALPSHHKRRAFSLEPLEERALLAVCTWDGGGSDNLWTNQYNWQGDVAPLAGDDLVFQGTARTETVNDYADGTSFRSLELASNNFALTGNGLTLTHHIAVDSGVTNSTISAGMVLSGAISVSVVDTSLSVSGVLSGTGSLVKSGSGTLTLTGTNTYSGGTQLSAGTLAFDNGSLGTSGSITFQGNSTLQWNGTNTQDISSRLVINSGIQGTLDVGSNSVTLASNFGAYSSGSLAKAGSGTLALNGSNSYTGGTTIKGGTLSFTSGGMGSSGAITVAADATLFWGTSNLRDISSRLVLANGVNATLDVGAASVTFSSAFGGGGSGAITKAGSGTLTLSGNNTYTGGTTVTAGTLAFASGGLGSSGTITVAGTSTLKWSGTNTLDISSRVVLNNGVTATLNIGTNDVTFATAIGNTTAALAKSGTGRLTLTTANSYTGGTTLNAGTVSFVSGSLGTTGAIKFASSSMLLWASGNTEDISGRLSATSGTATFDVGANTVTFASEISSGNFAKSGTGSLTLAGGDTATTVNATINAGTLQVGIGGTAGALGTNYCSIVNNGSLIFNRSTGITITGVISGTGSITQQGSGTLNLTATNTYTGGTTLNAGTVSFGNSGLGTSGTITVAGNATLQWGTNSTVDISSRLVLANGANATLNLGSNNVTLATAFGGGGSGAITKAGAGTLTLSGNNTYTGGTTISAGTLAFVAGGLGTTGAITVAGNSTLLWSGANTLDISRRLALANGVTATLNIGGNDVTFASPLGATSAGVVKSGSGQLTLSTANAHTGGTTLSEGTLSFVSGGLGSSGAITINGTATLVWSGNNTDDISGRLSLTQPSLSSMTATLDIGSNTVTFASAVSNTGTVGIIKLGSGSLIVAANNTLPGDWTNAGGTLQLGAGGTAGWLGSGAITNNGVLVFNRSDSITVSAAIIGTGSLIQQGTGTLILRSGSNSYTGGTTVYAGTLDFDNGALGSSGSITIADDATLQWWHWATSGNTQDVSSRLVLEDGVALTLNLQANNVTFANSIGSNSSGSVTKLGTGTLTFSAANTYTGSTTVNAGTLVFANGLDLNAGSTLTVNNSASVKFVGTQSLTGDGDVLLSSATATLLVQGTDSTTPAALTVAPGITIAGQGTVDGYYTADCLVNQGTIQTDNGTLALSLPVTNEGTLRAVGTAILAVNGTNLEGKRVALSGTELYLIWSGVAHDAESYAVQVSANDGTSYDTVSTVTATDKTFVNGNLQRNTSYRQRIVATSANGGQQIYDSGALSTLDLPDTSGWYRTQITNVNPNGPSISELVSGMAPSQSPIYAGSPAGAALKSLSGMVTDGTVPATNSSGTCELDGYTQMRDEPLLTFDLDPPGDLSVPERFLLEITCPPEAPNADCSEDPIRYSDGAVDYSTTDLESDALGSTFSQSRSWTSYSQWSVGQRNGTGWVDEGLPTIQQSIGGTTISVLTSATNATNFVLSNGQYVPTTYVADTLVHDTVNGEFVWADSEGNQIRFYDFSSTTPTGRQGQFKSQTDAGGLLTYVAAWTSEGTIQEVRRQDAQSQDVESWYYSYLPATDPNAGLISRVQLRKSDGNGGWTVARQVVYDYYETVSLITGEYGDRGDLKTASIQDGSGNVLDTSYYRYYGFGESGGYLHGLKYVFDSESYARLCAAVGDPTVANDAAVAPYAQHFFQYDQSRRCTRHDIRGTGGRATNGIGTFTYQYFANSTYSADANDWQYKTIETLPDGNQNTIYCNLFGQGILTDFADLSDSANSALSGQHWLTYRRFDAQGRVSEEAEPSAVTSYQIDSNNDLVVTLADSSGLIHVTEYYTGTTATATTAGGVSGYLKSTKIKQGELGTLVPKETFDYYKQANNGRSVVVLADDTVYRNTNGTGAETTSYSYAWYSGTVQYQSATRSLPIVTTAQNGSGAADTTIVVYDLYGRPTWTKDADGYLTYTTYDVLTGAVTKTITDVNTQNTTDFADLPTGWSTPTGGGLHLIATAEVDALGRTTKLVDPNGNVTYYVYDDVDHEVRIYAGWNATTHTTTGPIAVYREDRAGNYTERLTFVWDDMAGLPVDAQGRPTGAESLTDSRAVIESMSRILLNSVGQTTQTREFVDLDGVTYSTARDLGTYGVHYLQTNSSYGVWGQSVTTRDPSGTIDKRLYDSLGRLTSVLVGTNDTPGSSNMVVVQEYVYDNNGVGDGNLTQTTVHPGAGQADRVTKWAYDWRDRQILSKEGVQASEDTATNRPITYRVLDNLGEVLELDTYDGDGVSLASLGATNGVPNAPAAALLRAQATAAYDEQGRVYQLAEKVVNQSSGAIVATQTTDVWYSRRGEQIKAEAPNGSVTKFQYDGAGRVILEATTDGGGDLAWSDAATLTGDDVLAQTDYEYDANGNLTEKTDALDHVTAYGYDALDRLTSQTDASDGVTSYTYDAAGNLSILTDSVDNTTTWHYDLLGRCLQETNELGHSTYYTYDAQGNVVSTTDANGQVTAYTYDILGHQTAENWLDSQGDPIRAFSYTYDTVGDLLTASDPAASYTYSYNTLGQLTTITQTIAGLTPTVVFVQQYDANGERTQLAASVGGTADFVTDYAYDGLGDMLSVSQHGQTSGNAVAEKRVDLTYDEAGQFSTITRYADLAGTDLVATGTYGYDLAGQLTSLVYTKGLTTLVGYTWTYDTAGNLTQMANTLDGTADYTNDATGQLTATDYSGGQTDEAYSYDANGNRTNTGYQTGDDNQLLSDGTYSYAYDANGNRTLRYVDTDDSGTLTAGDTDITSYAWDYRNRLTTVTHFEDQTAYNEAESDKVVQYIYDYQNRLVKETVDSDGSTGTAATQQTVFVYDGSQIALEFNKTGTGDVAAADLSHRYLWGPAVDQFLADEQVGDLQTPGDVLWPLTDHLNTVRDLASYDAQNDTTSIANHRVYDSYGNLALQTNAAVDCLFGFTGRQFDQATGLQNNLNRWYDPEAGRWLSKDPIGFRAGDTNVCRYVENGPTNWVDPSGLAGPINISIKVNPQKGAPEWRSADRYTKNLSNTHSINVSSWEEGIAAIGELKGDGTIATLWITGHSDGSVPDVSKFPRDWLAKDATVYFIGCHTSDFAETFQRDVLPDGTTYGVDHYLAFDENGIAYFTTNGPGKHYAPDGVHNAKYPKLGSLVKGMHKFSKSPKQ